MSFFAQAQDYWSTLNEDAHKTVENSSLHAFRLNPELFEIKKRQLQASAKGEQVSMYFPNERNEMEAFLLSPVQLFSTEKQKRILQLELFGVKVRNARVCL